MAKIDPKTYQKKKRIKTHKLQRALPVIVGAVLVLLAVWWLNPGGIFTRGNVEVSGQPALQADQELIDLGDVKLGQTVSASFQLTNIGDRNLEFTKPPYVEIVEGC